MQLNLKKLILLGAVCSLYAGAFSQPYTNAYRLGRRGRIPTSEPKDPDPGTGMRSGDGAAPAVPVVHPGGSTGGGAAAIGTDFTPPASYTKQAANGKGTFMQQGQDVQKKLKDPSGPDAANDAVKDYDDAIKNPVFKVENQKREEIGDELPSGETVLGDLKIEESAEFRFCHVKAVDDDLDPLSDSYHSLDKKTSVLVNLDNSHYPPGFQGKKPRQSQIFFRQWEVEAGSANVGKLQYVWRYNVANPDTKAIIKDALNSKAGTKETFQASAADGSREKATFDALSGSDNGRMVFLMLSDNRQALGGKTVKDVTAYIDADGKYHMIWELTT